MKKVNNILTAAALLVAFLLVLTTGCAKKEVVKAEEMPVEKKATVEQTAPKPDYDALAREKAAADARERERQAQLGKQKTMESATVQEKEAYSFADIHFDFDKYDLHPEDRAILDKHAKWLMDNPSSSVRIEGNCDERGTSEYNMALGDRRALSAKKYLVDLGVSEGGISTISYGKEKPLDPGHNEEAWAKNRRDHFVVSK